MAYKPHEAARSLQGLDTDRLTSDAIIRAVSRSQTRRGAREPTPSAFSCPECHGALWEMLGYCRYHPGRWATGDFHLQGLDEAFEEGEADTTLPGYAAQFREVPNRLGGWGPELGKRGAGQAYVRAELPAAGRLYPH